MNINDVKNMTIDELLIANANQMDVAFIFEGIYKLLPEAKKQKLLLASQQWTKEKFMSKLTMFVNLNFSKSSRTPDSVAAYALIFGTTRDAAAKLLQERGY